MSDKHISLIITAVPWACAAVGFLIDPWAALFLGAGWLFSSFRDAIRDFVGL
jgi:hypothetical protein